MAMQFMTIPHLGHHLEICFSVSNLVASIEYYRQLGFRIYTGGPDESYCSMKAQSVYISLFENEFIEKEFGNPFILNFRGGNIVKLHNYLKKFDLDFHYENIRADGTGNLLFHDPDGVPIFLDTSPDEERIDTIDQ